MIQLAVDLGEGHMTIGAQRYLLAGCLHNPLSQAFPPIASYITKTLKYAAQAAEADGEECDDSLVEELCARVASGASPCQMINCNSMNGNG